MDKIYSKEEMLKEVGISNSTYVSWYIAYKRLTEEQKSKITALPKRRRDAEDIRKLIFTDDDIRCLKEFKQFIRTRGKGAFRAYNRNKNKRNPNQMRGWRYE